MTPELKELMLEAARIYHAWQDAILQEATLNVTVSFDKSNGEFSEQWDTWIASVGLRHDLWGAHLKAEKKLYNMIDEELK